MRGLGILLAAWAVILGVALVWGVVAGHGTVPAVAGRMGSSLLLVLTAALAWKASRAPLIAWVLAGICLGTLGDFANAGLVSGGTLAAMGAFGIGHLCYMTGIFGALRARRANALRMVSSLAGWWLAGVVGWYIVVWGAPSRGLEALVWPALAYTLLLAATAGFATALALADRHGRPLAAGAALFLLSDLILAVVLFRGPFAGNTLAVWIPYGLGQMLIVFTAARLSLRPALHTETS